MLAEGTRPQDRRPSRPSPPSRPCMAVPAGRTVDASSGSSESETHTLEMLLGDDGDMRGPGMYPKPRQLAAPQAPQMKVGADWGVG